MKMTLFNLLVALSVICFSAFAEETDDSTTTIQAVEKEPEVQEVKYVTDKLRLSLYKRADSNSGVLFLLSSGDTLEVLGKSGPYSKVRAENGKIGWVKNGFLVSIPTASIQLAEEKGKNEILSQQLEQYSDTKKLVADYENTIRQINEDVTSTEQKLSQANQEMEALIQLNEKLKLQIEVTQQDNFQISDIIELVKKFWHYLAAAVTAIMLFGFLLGSAIMEARVRRRFQGIKVW